MIGSETGATIGSYWARPVSGRMHDAEEMKATSVGKIASEDRVSSEGGDGGGGGGMRVEGGK